MALKFYVKDKKEEKPITKNTNTSSKFYVKDTAPAKTTAAPIASRSINPYAYVGQEIIPVTGQESALGKIGKGIVNYGLGTVGRTVSSVTDLMKQGAYNIGKAATGQKTDFSKQLAMSDVFGDKYKAWESKQNPFVKGFVGAASESLLDPTTFVAGGIVDDLARAGRTSLGTFGKAGALGTTENVKAAAAAGQKLMKKYPSLFKTAAKQADIVQPPKMLTTGTQLQLPKTAMSKIELPAPGAAKAKSLKKLFPDTTPTAKVPEQYKVERINAITPAEAKKLSVADLKPPQAAKAVTAPTGIQTRLAKAAPGPADTPLKFPQTVRKGDITTPELKSAIKKADLTGGTITNADTLNKAKNIIATDYDEAVKMVKGNSKATADSYTVAQLLAKEAQDTGKWQEALDIVEITSRKAREQGQAIQALSIWGRLTPEGMLKYAQRVVDNANTKILNKAKKLKLDPDFAQDITKRMKGIAAITDEEVKAYEIAKVLRDITSKVPKSIAQKVSTVQTMAQLLNPKTTVRNFIGNAAFATAEDISQTIGTPLDKIISKFTGQRTTFLPSIKTQAQGFTKGLKTGAREAIEDINLSAATQFDLPANRTFKTGFLGKAETAMALELRATDKAFYQAGVEESLRQQMRAAGTKAVLPEMVEIANQDGLYKTFQDKNFATTVFTGLKKALNGGKEFGFGDIILKYPKTPANLLMRGIDYSPAGIAKSLFALRKGFNQRDFVMGISRGIVGSGILGAAGVLYNLGIITGQQSRDKDVNELNREVGLGSYKLNTSALFRLLKSGLNAKAGEAQEGDTLISYDWAQPLSISAGAGANIAEQLKEKKSVNALDVFGAVVTAMEGGIKTLAEQPLVQGITNVFQGYDPVESLIKQPLAAAPASFIPTFVNQVKQLIDNKSRQTVADNPVKEAINRVMNKIPGLSSLLPERVTTLGETRETYQGGSNKLLNVFLNPAITTKYAPTPATTLVLDLYKSTGETKQFPRVAAKTVTLGGETYKLTSDQQNELQRIVGQETLKQFNQLAQSRNFEKLTNEAKLELLYKKLNDIGEIGRNKIKQQIINLSNVNK